MSQTPLRSALRARAEARAERARRDRGGFTLVELLVVVVLGAILLAGVYQTLVVQESSFRVQDAMASTQQNMRVALEIVAGELREVSPAPTATEGGDLANIAADSVSFRAFRKAGVTCINLSGGELGFEVYQVGERIAAGDSLLVFRENNPSRSGDDRWIPYYVTSASAGVAGCNNPPSGFFNRKVSTDSITGSDIRPGAPVRSFVWMTYGVYQDTDGTWWLGRHPRGSSEIQYLVGPLASKAAGGLQFRYFDANGNVTATPANVRRIQIRIKGQSRSLGATPGGGNYVDSLTTQIYLRNN